MLLQCISCGDCREATDYTSDPQKWGVCVARDNTSGFEAFFGRGKMQIIRSLWQRKLELSKDLSDYIRLVHDAAIRKNIPVPDTYEFFHGILNESLNEYINRFGLKKTMYIIENS